MANGTWSQTLGLDPGFGVMRDESTRRRWMARRIRAFSGVSPSGDGVRLRKLNISRLYRATIVLVGLYYPTLLEKIKPEAACGCPV